MTKQFSTDVTIVGAGAAGMTLAIELGRRGISFRLIDKLDGPLQGSRGKGLQPRTLEIFDDLGILDQIAAAGGTFPPQRQYRDDGTHEDTVLAEGPQSSPAEPYRWPLLAAQFATEAAMRERLAELGGDPEYGRELRGLTQDANGVVATVSGPSGDETIRSQYLVGTDGGRSFVRHTLGIGFPGKTLGVRALVADVELEGLTRDAWHRFNDGRMESQIGACPLLGTDMFQMQGPVAPDGDIDISAAGLTAMFAVRTGRKDIVVRTVRWASVFSMSARLADRYQDGRVFLAGDAAHVHPPTGGQGLNTSVQDAYNLGWKLSAVLAGAPVKLLSSYEEERRPAAAHALGLSTSLLEAAKRGKTVRGRELHQLDLGYPGSSLALAAPATGDGLAPGDRAPDCPLRGAAGAARRLFDLFNGPHWTLIEYGAGREPIVAPRAGLRTHTVSPRGSQAELVDEDGQFQAAYGLALDHVVLVRPDGYVGAILPSSDVSRLDAYLDAVGMSASSSARGFRVM